MVLLELIGGRRNITLAENGKSTNSKSKFSYFPKIVSEKLEQGKIMEVVDERLVHEAATGGVAVEMQVKRLACVALSCIQERPSLRPTMARVVEMLEGRVLVEAPTQTTMMILDLLDEGVDHHPGYLGLLQPWLDLLILIRFALIQCLSSQGGSIYE